MNREKRSEGELLRESIQQISKKWHPQIIYTLLSLDEASFKQIKDEVEGISNKVLSGSLKDLRDKQLIEKAESDEKAIYRLTPRGKALEPILNDALSWGEKYLSDFSSLNILFVEDDLSQAKMYERWLEDLHNVEIAKNGTEVMDKLSEDTDIIFLDRSLPETNAADILDMIKDFTKDKYVVMLTAMEPQIDLLDLDIQDYLIKPVNKEDIEEVLESIKINNSKTSNAKKLWSLAAKKSLLEEKNQKEDLEKEEKYISLLEEIEELKEDMQEIPDSLSVKL